MSDQIKKHSPGQPPRPGPGRAEEAKRKVEKIKEDKRKEEEKKKAAEDKKAKQA